jgi:hypothetical protein
MPSHWLPGIGGDRSLPGTQGDRRLQALRSRHRSGWLFHAVRVGLALWSHRRPATPVAPHSCSIVHRSDPRSGLWRDLRHSACGGSPGGPTHRRRVSGSQGRYGARPARRWDRRLVGSGRGDRARRPQEAFERVKQTDFWITHKLLDERLALFLQRKKVP